MQSEDFAQQVSSTLEYITKLEVFKIFGQQNFKFDKAKYPNLVDWSGLYTQLSPEHSMRYLTKKWDDGADHACLLRFRPKNTQLRLLKVKHPHLCSPKIPGQLKARSIKHHLSLKYTELKQIQSEKLLQYLGRHLILLQCVDADDQQIIIPHDILNQKYFKADILVHFEKSKDGMLRTIKYRMVEDIAWCKIVGQHQFQPYLLLKQNQFQEKLEVLLKKL